MLKKAFANEFQTLKYANINTGALMSHNSKYVVNSIVNVKYPLKTPCCC